MGGLGFLLTIAFYLVVAVAVVVAVKGTQAKLLATAIVILLPTADAIVGRIYLSHLCRTEGGLVVKNVSHKEKGFRILGGVFADHDQNDSLKAWLGKYGVSFIEGQYKKDGTVDRVSLENDEIKRERNVLPRSEVEISFVPGSVDDLFPRQVDIARDVRTGEVLGTHTLIGFRGGWAEHLLGKFSDAGPSTVSWCSLPRGEDRRVELVRRTIVQ